MVTNDDYNDDPSRWLPKPNHDESEMATTTITTTTTMTTTATLTTSKTTKCFSFSFSFWLSVRLIVSWWWLIHGQGGYCVSAAVRRYHLRLFSVYTGLSNNTIVNGFTSFGFVCLQMDDDDDGVYSDSHDHDGLPLVVELPTRFNIMAFPLSMITRIITFPPVFFDYTFNEYFQLMLSIYVSFFNLQYIFKEFPFSSYYHRMIIQLISNQFWQNRIYIWQFEQFSCERSNKKSLNEITKFYHLSQVE